MSNNYVTYIEGKKKKEKKILLNKKSGEKIIIYLVFFARLGFNEFAYKFEKKYLFNN